MNDENLILIKKGERRAAKPDEIRKDHQITARVTVVEHYLTSKIARGRGMTISQLLRAKLGLRE